MPTFEELRDSAGAARKMKNYPAALHLYEELFASFGKRCGSWEAWGLAFCLTRLGRYEEALDICRTWYPRDKENVYLRSVYCEAIYKSAMKGNPPDDETGQENWKRAAVAIVQLSAPDSFFLHLAVLRYIDFLKKKNLVDWRTILVWTGYLQPGKLSADPGSGKNDDGKSVEFASHREKWYAARIKALLETGKYVECAELATEALRVLVKPHYGNEVWFRMWRIQARWRSGDRTPGLIADARELAARKNEWFIHHQLAVLLHESGQDNEAFQQAIAAMVGHGDLHMKTKVLMLLAEMLLVRGEADLAARHVECFFSQREEKYLRSDKAMELANRYTEGRIQMLDKKGLDGLRTWWQNTSRQANPEIRGSVKTFISDKGFGFLVDESGHEHFFHIHDWRDRRNEPCVGDMVIFRLEDKFDQKKNAVKKTAVSVQPVRDR